MRLIFQICVALPLAVCVLASVPGSGIVRAAEKPAVYHNIPPSGKVQFYMPEGFHKVREDYVSPHIPWGKPYAGGAVKALIIGSRYAHRETVELAQRLSLEYETIMTLGKTDEFIPEGLTDRVVGCSAEDYRTEFEKKLAGDYDVIICGRFYWEALPPEYEKLLLDKLRSGTGLLLVCPEEGRSDKLNEILADARDEAGERHIMDGVPVDKVPGFFNEEIDRSTPLVQCGSYGDGKVAVINYADIGRGYTVLLLTPAPPKDIVAPALAYDYYLSLACRAAIWAAGKSLQVAIEGVNMPTEPIEADKFAAKPVEIQVRNNSGGKFSAELEIVARTWKSQPEKVVLEKMEIALGKSVRAVEIPRLSGGPHFIDFWLRRDDEVVDWFTKYIEIIPSANVSGIKLAQPSFPVGGKVEGSVMVSGALDGGMRLEIEMLDSRDRLMARYESELSGQAASVDFSFPFDQPVLIQHRITAKLVDKDGMVDYEERLFAPRDLKKYDDFAFVAWGGVGDNPYRQRMIADRCYELGADSAYGYGLRESEWEKNPVAYWTTRSGLSMFFYGSYLGGKVKDKIRSRCLSDPKYIEYLQSGIAALAEINRHMGGIGYSTGDEYPLARPGEECCWSEWCLADLREWLKERYGTLEELNHVWKTDFASWDAVEPATLDEAKASGNYAPWSDGRAHMEYVFARIHNLMRLAVEKHHEDAPVGEEGMFDADTYHGPDWELFRDAATLLHGYERPAQHEHIRSLAREGDVTGYWFGSYYARDYAEEKMRWHPWFSLFNGYNSAWWWTVSGSGTSEYPGGFNPDLTPCAIFDWTMQEVREIKSGPGKLLLNCKRQNDSIAIHYSMNSRRASYSHPIPDDHWTGAAHHARLGIGPSEVAWCMILEDMGLQYEYVCTADIEKGALIDRGFKAFIMPVSQSVTDGEADGIREFARSGGMVFADLRPGVLNSVLNSASPGLLDDLFGTDRPHGLKSTRAMDVTIPIGDKSYDLPGSHVDSGLKLTSAKAAGGSAEAPAVIQNSFGEGRAVLLNFGLGDYYDEWRGEGSLVTDLRNTPWGQSIRGIVGDLLAQGGIKPRVEALRENGNPLIGVESVFFSSGGNEYLGMIYKPDIIYFLNGNVDWICANYDLQPDTSPVPITAKLDRRCHVYDVRKGQYVGYTDHITTEVAPGQALLYSLLPYKVTGVSLQAPDAAICGERTEFRVSAEVDGGDPGMHCFRVEIISPAGDVVKEYAQNVIGADGSAAFTVPFALNDSTGVWRIKVRDVASGMAATAEVNLVVSVSKG